MQAFSSPSLRAAKFARCLASSPSLRVELFATDFTRRVARCWYAASQSSSDACLAVSSEDAEHAVSPPSKKEKSNTRQFTIIVMAGGYQASGSLANDIAVQG